MVHKTSLQNHGEIMDSGQNFVFLKQLGLTTGLLVTFAASMVHANEGVAICAIEQAIACSPFSECDRNLPGAFNIPVLIKLDTASSRLTSMGIDGQELTSEIYSVVETETAIVLSGVDADHPWAASIVKDTGRMAATVIQPDDTFIVFGECSWGLAK